MIIITEAEQISKERMKLKDKSTEWLEFLPRTC